ncbi:hypothetical protein E6H23_00130 [Candidatus Bathyarchaeota archaeon]|nr:MAG: hypothetical protein E6H23_00130 [Candidatus Bathyarchaeota archaeon]
MKIRYRTLVVLLPLLLPVATFANEDAPIASSSDLYLSAEGSTLSSIESTNDLNVDGNSAVTPNSESQCPDLTDLHSSMEVKMFNGGNSFSFGEFARERMYSCPLTSLRSTSESVRSSVDSFRVIQTRRLEVYGYWAWLIGVLGIIVHRRSESSVYSTRFKKRRNRIDMLAEILRVSVAGTRKTRIIQSANLNSKIIEGYLVSLEQAGLLQRPTARPSIFITTTRGQLFLLLYLKMNELLSREMRGLKTPRILRGRGEVWPDYRRKC